MANDGDVRIDLRGDGRVILYKRDNSKFPHCLKIKRALPSELSAGFDLGLGHDWALKRPVTPLPSLLPT